MAYLIPNESATVFLTRVHHFSTRPTGPRLVESPPSRMVVVCAPWSEIHDLLANLGSMRLAAYLLAGAGWPEGIITRCYVGETGDVMARLKRHASDPNKNFVSEVFVIASRDGRFDKTDVQLLQYQLNAWIEKLDRAHIVRGVRPTLPYVDPSRQRQSMQDFAHVRRLLPSLGCNLLEARDGIFTRKDVQQNEFASNGLDGSTADDHNGEPEFVTASGQGPQDACAPTISPNCDRPEEPSAAPAARRSSLFVLQHSTFIATGYQDGPDFVVLPGSEMRRTEMESFKNGFADGASNRQRRKDIEQSQSIAEVKGYSDRWRLIEERRFKSRGIAASVLMGVNLAKDSWIEIRQDTKATYGR
jgi:hypothetical protein